MMAKPPSSSKTPNDFREWKKCVALSKLGWKIIKCEKLSENSSTLVIFWHKEGKEDLKVKLSFLEQSLWIDYLEKRNQDDKQ